MWSIIFGLLKSVVGPVFQFLNARVDANERMHISDNVAAASLGAAVVQTQGQAIQAQAQVRLAEGKWSPWVLCTICFFMIPFGWHTWQIVLDSSAWVFGLSDWYLPTITKHVVGSWKVAKLPGMWEQTEHAVINSLFIGAGVGVGALGVVRALRGR